MNNRFLSGLALAPAAIIAAGLVAATPAKAADVWCNPVIGWTNQVKDGVAARTADGGYVIHSGSYLCPAAAMAPPPTTLQREYLVFFDWDKSNITPAADRIISDMVAAMGKQPVKIKVVGHTDTSGKPSYNQKLSVRRATAVRTALVAKGVAASTITTEGKGETELLVKTGPNVREPSNRRAQILPQIGPTS